MTTVLIQHWRERTAGLSVRCLTCTEADYPIKVKDIAGLKITFAGLKENSCVDLRTSSERRRFERILRRHVGQTKCAFGGLRHWTVLLEIVVVEQHGENADEQIEQILLCHAGSWTETEWRIGEGWNGCEILS